MGVSILPMVQSHGALKQPLEELPFGIGSLKPDLLHDIMALVEPALFVKVEGNADGKEFFFGPTQAGCKERMMHVGINPIEEFQNLRFHLLLYQMKE